METLVLQTKNKRQTKELLAYAKAMEIKAYTPEEVKAQATAKWIMEGLASGMMSQEETKALFDSYRK